MKSLNVGIVGYKFMGKAHSNAWRKAPYFFDMDVTPVLKVACGRNRESLKEFADRWGWEQTESDWKKMVHRDDVDIVDISAPQYMHYEIAMEAARAGKHIFCEKPLAMDSAQAREMNELQYFSAEDPAEAQGFRTILATEGVHQYVANWWPPGHIIGFEHAFVHAVVDFLKAVETKTKIEPNFYDGMRGMQVLEAGLRSAETGTTVTLA